MPAMACRIVELEPRRPLGFTSTVFVTLTPSKTLCYSLALLKRLSPIFRMLMTTRRVLGEAIPQATNGLCELSPDPTEVGA
jgi:hypothetical protein